MQGVFIPTSGRLEGRSEASACRQSQRHSRSSNPSMASFCRAYAPAFKQRKTAMTTPLTPSWRSRRVWCCREALGHSGQDGWVPGLCWPVRQSQLRQKTCPQHHGWLRNDKAQSLHQELTTYLENHLIKGTTGTQWAIQAENSPQIHNVLPFSLQILIESLPRAWCVTEDKSKLLPQAAHAYPCGR